MAASPAAAALTKRAASAETMPSLSRVDAALKTWFGQLGFLVGEHRIWFLVLPVLLAACLGSGMWFVEYSSDPDHLLTPLNGQGRTERALAERYFPTNFSHFDATRSLRYGLYGYVMVTGNNGTRRSVLQPEAWAEVRTIQQRILAIRVEHEGRFYGYQDICVKWNGECYTNSLLSVADTFAVLSRGVFRETIMI